MPHTPDVVIAEGAQVRDSFVAGRDLHVTVVHALQAPPVPGRIFAVSAYEDRAFVEIEVQRLRALGKDVAWKAPSEPPPEHLDDAMRRALQQAVAHAETVWVFHSVAANRDAFVQDAIAFTTELLAERAEARPRAVAGQLVGVSLDGSPLPAALTTKPGSPSPWVWLGWWMAVGAMAWAVLREPDLPVATWALLSLAVLLATVVMGLQVMRRPDWLLRTARLYAAGQWLDAAGMTELLALSDGILDRVFGVRMVSWRSVLVSAAISSLSVVPLGLIWGSILGEGFLVEDVPGWFGTVFGAMFSLVVTGPLALGNVFFDFLSLLVTRSVLRRLVRRPHPVRHWAGLLLDLVLVMTCAVGTVYTNLAGFAMIGLSSGSWFAWPQVVVATALAAIGGDLHLANAFVDFFTAAVLVSAVAMFTATLPSLVHGTLLLTGFGNGLLGHRPLRWSGEALRRWADTPSGPWTVVSPAAVSGLVAAGMWLATPPTEATPTSPDELVAGQWVLVDATGCDTPCRIGCPESEDGCARERGELEREIDPPPPFELLRTEVTQDHWESVWLHGAALAPEPVRAMGFDGTVPLPVQLGLPRNPSVHAGPRHPVERVSWCDAVRFANLWSILDGLEPAYVGAQDGGTAALEDCERAGATWRDEADGYRLPTEVEWELAARGGGTIRTAFWSGPDARDALAVDWLAPNSGWRTHPVDAVPDEARGGAHPLGLRGVHGNVSEWVWDPYDPTADGLAGARRVIRGGSFQSVPAYARAAYRDGSVPRNRDADQGFRLVRASAPSR